MSETQPFGRRSTVGAFTAKAPVVAPCANCGAALQGRFCHACGQSAEIANDFKGLARDLIGRVVSFDYSVIRGVWRLIVQPGQLASDWFTGKRVGVITPWQTALLALSLFYLVPLISDYLVSRSFSVDQGGEDTLYRYWGVGFLATVIPVHFAALSLVVGRRPDATPYRQLVVTLYQLGGLLLTLLPAGIVLRYSLSPLAILLPPVAMVWHVGLMLRGAYGLSPFGAAWRAIIVMLIDGFGFTVVGGLTMSLFMGAAG